MEVSRDLELRTPGAERLLFRPAAARWRCCAVPGRGRSRVGRGGRGRLLCSCGCLLPLPSHLSGSEIGAWLRVSIEEVPSLKPFLASPSDPLVSPPPVYSQDLLALWHWGLEEDKFSGQALKMALETEEDRVVTCGPRWVPSLSGTLSHETQPAGPRDNCAGPFKNHTCGHFCAYTCTPVFWGQRAVRVRVCVEDCAVLE